MPIKPSLSVFKLVMMSVIAIDSLKNLSSNAQYGSALILYYLAAIILFFIPSALICAELAASVPKEGGAYAWVREAFGNYFAFITGWMQWLIAITWAPTILTFCIVTFMTLFLENTLQNKLFILLTMLIIFWGTIYLITHGIKLFSIIISSSAVIGVIIPMLAITCLGITWLIKGNPTQIHFNINTSKLEIFNAEHLRLFIPLLYSLMGMEIIGVHATHVSNPARQYPLAIFIAACLIAITSISASLAIAIVIPHSAINLTSGFIMTAKFFLSAFHINYLLPFFVMAIVIGCYGSFYNWMLTVSQYLLTAAEDGSLPTLLRKKNKNGMPVNLLILQGIIFSFLAIFFILMPSIESAFWLLSVCCAQFALLYYIILFSAAVYLRFKQPNLPRPFRVGRSPLLIIMLSTLAILTCSAVFLFGFIPPNDLTVAEQTHYVRYLISIMLAGLSLGAAIFCYSRIKSVKTSPVLAQTENV